MHPTRDTAALINNGGACGRVMPGVRRLLRVLLFNGTSEVNT